MNDITDLERRIADALQRIGQGVQALERPSPPVEPTPSGLPAAETLQAELEAERQVSAQLEERVRAVHAKLSGRVIELQEALNDARKSQEAAETERDRLKMANMDIGEKAEALHTSSQSRLADAELANKTLMNELDAVKAARAADRAEMDAILAELQPVIEEATGA